MQPFEQGKQRCGENVDAAIVFGQFEIGRGTFENFGNLRAGIQIGRQRFALAGRNLDGGGVNAGAVQVFAHALNAHLAAVGAGIGAFFRLHHPGRHEIVLDHAGVAALAFALVFGGVAPAFEVVVELGKFNLLEFALGRVHHRPGIAVHKPALALGRGIVADDLVVAADFQRLAAGVFQLKADIDQIAVFAEGIDFFHLQAVLLGRAQAHFQLVAFKRVAFLGGAEAGFFQQIIVLFIHYG